MYCDDKSRIHAVGKKQHPFLSPLPTKQVYVLFEAHAGTEHSPLEKQNNACPPQKKYRAMSVHAGTQCWILDGAPPILPFTLPCTLALLKKHAPKYSFTRASADEGHENTEQIAPQGRLSPCFQRCYLHLFACGWTRKSDPRLNQPESGSLGHQQDARFANRVPCTQ